MAGDAGHVQPLMGIGILDRTGMAPQPFLGAFLVSEGDVHRLTLLHGGLHPSWDDPNPPAPPDAWWAGIDTPTAARWRQAGVEFGVESLSLVEPIPPVQPLSAIPLRLAGGPAAVLRSVLPSDAAWLSQIGFDACPDFQMLRLLAALHARNWGAVEEIRAIAYPRLPPHGLRYRVRPYSENHGGPVDLFWSGGRWRRRGAVPADPRLATTLALVRERPWLWGDTAKPPTHVGDLLLVESGPVIRPWGLRSALACFAEDPVGHEEVLLHLLSCPLGTEVTPETLGDDLTGLLRRIGRRIDELHRLHYPEGIDELTYREEVASDGFGSEFVPEEPYASEARLASLSDADLPFRFDVAQLVDLLEIVPETVQFYEDEIH